MAKKTVRKHELRQKIATLERRLLNMDGELYGVAVDVFEELRDSSAGRDKYERRAKFRAMTIDVSLSLYMFLKKNISPQSFKYSSDWLVYFGTDEEFEELFGKQ
tara:strand:+ start:669 stop:980 length:312 start_codon:yes stop_codon:yes gene_type:complete